MRVFRGDGTTIGGSGGGRGCWSGGDEAGFRGWIGEQEGKFGREVELLRVAEEEEGSAGLCDGAEGVEEGEAWSVHCAGAS